MVTMIEDDEAISPMVEREACFCFIYLLIYNLDDWDLGKQ